MVFIEGEEGTNCGNQSETRITITLFGSSTERDKAGCAKKI